MFWLASLRVAGCAILTKKTNPIKKQDQTSSVNYNRHVITSVQKALAARDTHTNFSYSYFDETWPKRNFEKTRSWSSVSPPIAQLKEQQILRSQKSPASRTARPRPAGSRRTPLARTRTRQASRDRHTSQSKNNGKQR